MTRSERQGLERAIDLCLAARAEADGLGSSHLRVLFDILLLELARAFARCDEEGPA